MSSRLQLDVRNLSLGMRHLVTPRLRLRTSNCSLLLIYLPWKDKRLSRPGWLTYSGRFTHISGHPSVASRVQDSESSPVRDRRSTTVPRNQPWTTVDCLISSNRCCNLPGEDCMPANGYRVCHNRCRMHLRCLYLRGCWNANFSVAVTAPTYANWYTVLITNPTTVSRLRNFVKCPSS